MSFDGDVGYFARAEYDLNYIQTSKILKLYNHSVIEIAGLALLESNRVVVL